MTDLALLLPLADFQLKQVPRDFVLQHACIRQHYAICSHPGGLLHVAIHAALTLSILLTAGAHGLLFLEILFGEAMFRDHSDWLKERCIYSEGRTASDRQYWQLLRTDQMLHQLC